MLEISKPTVHQLPWPRLNCLLAGLPGFSPEYAFKGGIADGEVKVPDTMDSKYWRLLVVRGGADAEEARAKTSA